MSLRPMRVLTGIIFITGGLLILGRNLAIDPILWQLVVSGAVGFFGAAALLIFSFSPRWCPLRVEGRHSPHTVSPAAAASLGRPSSASSALRER